MRIFKANLTHRFNVSDGWTREKVAEMMAQPDIQFVIPRYYDFERDDPIIKKMKHFVLPETMNKEKFTDCDYFAVYALDQTLCNYKLNEHEINYISDHL